MSADVPGTPERRSAHDYGPAGGAQDATGIHDSAESSAPTEGCAAHTPQTRALFVTDSLGNGGAERQLALLATNLPAYWRPEVWSLTPGPWAEPIAQAGIPLAIVQRSWRFDVTPALKLWRRLRASRPDVVYAQGWMAAVSAGPACALLKIPLVDSRMRSASISKDIRQKVKLGLRFSDIVIANSAAGLSALRLRSSKGRVIPNGFDCSRVLPRRHEVFSREPFTVVMAARMQEMKDWDLYIALARLLTSEQQGRWRFVAVGDGPERARLIDASSDLIAGMALEFVPEVKEVMPLLVAADVGVLLTNPHRVAEGCSNSILEYMAARLPVVCSDSGGNSELVKDGVTGFVVPGQDAAALADRLSALAVQPQKAREMGELGSRRVHEEYSIELLVRRTIAAFEDAAARKTAPRDRTGRQQNRTDADA